MKLNWTSGIKNPVISQVRNRKEQEIYIVVEPLFKKFEGKTENTKEIYTFLSSPD